MEHAGDRIVDFSRLDALRDGLAPDQFRSLMTAVVGELGEARTAIGSSQSSSGDFRGRVHKLRGLAAQFYMERLATAADGILSGNAETDPTAREMLRGEIDAVLEALKKSAAFA